MAKVVMGSIAASDRPKWEDSLIALYIEVLKKENVTTYSIAQAKQDLRLFKIYPLCLWIMTAKSLYTRMERVKQKVKSKTATQEDLAIEAKSKMMRERLMETLVADQEVENMLKRMPEDLPLPFLPCCCYWA